MCELKPPEEVRGQRILDRKAFKKEIKIPVFTLSTVNISNILPHLKKYFLKLENLKPVQSLNDSVVVHLNPFLVKKFSSFSPDVQSALMNMNLTEENLEMKTVTVGYENFSLETILRAVLPTDKEGTVCLT